MGTAVLRHGIPNNGHYEWRLAAVKRMKRPRRVNGKPQPVWFRPF